jgi:hypothetical protein
MVMNTLKVGLQEQARDPNPHASSTFSPRNMLQSARVAQSIAGKNIAGKVLLAAVTTTAAVVVVHAALP